MSATFKLAKKKHTQHDLRRIMNEQKPKHLAAGNNTKTTVSPLAKYNDLGQLMCVLCKSVVRSEDVWKVHVNAKQHKQNLCLAKQLKEKTQNLTETTIKRPASPAATVEVPPQKKLKSILKNSSASETAKPMISDKSNLPSDFFDESPSSKIETSSFFEATLQKTTIRKDLINIRQRPSTTAAEDATVDELPSAAVTDDTLPEGFFDDPIKDAKARNLDYKDPVEEEWDRFQKEIKAAADFSNAIIAEDQEEATAERQIDEIDEQIRNWSRVLNLEKKKEVDVKGKQQQQQPTKSIDKNKTMGSSDEEDEPDDLQFDEFLDWRAKKSYR